MRLPLLATALSLVLIRETAAAEAPAAAKEIRPGPACHLGLLPDAGSPDNPRIALFRDRNAEGCETVVLDTGYRLSAVATSRDQKRLGRGKVPFSCALEREQKAALDWEKALLRILAPGFRGEGLLHLGKVEEALEAFFEGLPDRRCEFWLSQAARNLPGPVASRLPGALRSRDALRAASALEVLGSLVSSHPGAAREPVEAALGLRHRALRPRALLLAGEEAAGLRAGDPGSPGAATLAGRIEAALADRDPTVRGAAADALLLTGTDDSRRIALLAGAIRTERDAATRPLLLSALGEAGGTGEIVRLSRSGDPELRRDALRAAAGLADWPAGEPDPLVRLLQEEKVDPGEVVRRLQARRGELPSSWATLLGQLLPALSDEDRARVPSILCRLDDSGGGEEGVTVLLEMARKERGIAGTAALAALESCGAGRREESLAILLEAAGNRERDEPSRIAAAVSAAGLAEASGSYDQVLDFLRAALEEEDGISRRIALAGLVRLGHQQARPPATLLAPLALESPADVMPPGAGEAFRRLFNTAPGPVTEALREMGRDRTAAEQEKVFEFFRSLKPEKRDRILERWRSALSAPDARAGPAILSEMRSLVDYWPDEIFSLIQPVFENARGEERIRILDLMVELGRQLPARVLPLLTLPEGSSPLVVEATREAVAATMARGILAEPGRGPQELMEMALDPSDAERRMTGRQALWLLAWESPSRRAFLVPWAREARREIDFPRRAELGRWLAQVSELGPTRFPVTPEARQEPRKARFLPGTSGDSAPAP